jgi:Cytochrome P460
MNRVAFSATVLGGLIVALSATAIAREPKQAKSPLYGVRLPHDYRDWTLISVAHEAGSNNDIRAILGNRLAVRAFRDDLRPFPEGAVIARLAWRYQSSPRNDAVFPAPQSYVAGDPTNVQISVKDSRRYAATAGWGYGQFENGKANLDLAVVQSCATCHAKLDRLDSKADRVFTRYSH